MNDDAQTHTKMDDVMRRIREGRVQMRPRWHFILSTTLLMLGALIMLLTLLYVASVAFFSMRFSGAFFAPLFGMRGLFAFFQALPSLLIFLLIAFVIVLEVLVRRFRVGYRAPLLVSAAAILVIVMLGGFAIERTHMHRFLFEESRDGRMPSVIGGIYRGIMPPPPPGLHRGTVISTGPNPDQFVMYDESSNKTATVTVGVLTRLPWDGMIAPGQDVAVFGDDMDGVVRAIGVEHTGDSGY